jgi:hypothetical protein
LTKHFSLPIHAISFINRKTMLKLLLTILLLCLVGYGVLVALVYTFQERLVYFPPRPLVQNPAAAGYYYEDVWLQTADGVRLHGWFIPAKDARATLLFFHGNASNISHLMLEVTSFHAMGLNTLLIDYRGYGQSEGQPNEAGTYRDAAAAWRYLTEERQIPAAEIIVVGRSLGGGVAAWVAETYSPRALVLESTFTSLPDVGAQSYPLLPVRLLSRNHYPTIERLPRLTLPVLILHSRDDDIIPFSHGQQLYAAAREPKSFVAMRGNHNAGFQISSRLYRDAWETFLDEVLPTTGSTAMLRAASGALD